MRLHPIPLPVSPVEKLAFQFQKYLCLPEPDVLYALIGSVAANMMEGTPVWLMLIGPPSCGKSELLNSLLKVPQMIEGADIASEAAFLSGSPARDKAKDATGGMLCQVRKHGGILLNDFTSILSKPPDKIAMIMSVLRECYGGRWTRNIGAEGGRALQWTGKLAMLAGVTGEIDRHHVMSARLGERWIYWRYEERDVFSDCVRSASMARGTEWRQELGDLVASFFDSVNLHFGTNLPRRDLTIPEQLRMYDLASIGARCRSGVARDNWSKEIISIKETELATRLFTILAQLFIAMDYIGVPESIRWRILKKIIMDSMPGIRKLVLSAVTNNPLTMEDLTRILRCHSNTAKRVVEDLEVQDIVIRKGSTVSLSKWMNENYRKVYREGPNLVPGL